MGRGRWGASLGSHCCSLCTARAYASALGRRTDSSSPRWNVRLSHPLTATGEMGNAAHCGNCLATRRFTSLTSICIRRGYQCWWLPGQRSCCTVQFDLRHVLCGDGRRPPPAGGEHQLLSRRAGWLHRPCQHRVGEGTGEFSACASIPRRGVMQRAHTSQLNRGYDLLTGERWKCPGGACLQRPLMERSFLRDSAGNRNLAGC